MRGETSGPLHSEVPRLKLHADGFAEIGRYWTNALLLALCVQVRILPRNQLICFGFPS